MALDLIVCWPRTADYPRFREWIAKNQHRFGEVIAVFTDLQGPTDYSGWLRGVAPEITFLDSPAPNGDWRDTAVNAALDRSTADRVWFTEQDVHLRFWPITRDPVVGWDAEDGRPFHPACLFVDRHLVDRTSRYFGPDPVDHFCAFGRELLTLANPTYITGIVTHMQAITESQQLLGLGQPVKFHPERFRVWLADQLTAPVALHPEWEARAREFTALATLPTGPEVRR